MKRILFRSVILANMLVLMVGVNAFAANGKYNKQEGRALRGNVDVSRALAYSFPNDKARSGGSVTAEPTRVPIGSMSLSTGWWSPGVVFGNTWYDCQQTGSMGRMIETGPYGAGTGYTIVHMGWMYLPEKKLEDRSYAYNAYFSQDHSMAGQTILMTEGEYGGYVNVDVTPDNRAIVGGHNDDGTGTAPEFRFDGGPGYATFPNILRVPDSVQNFAQNDPTESALWPKFFFQYGTDTVFHVVAEVSDNDNNAMAIMYFRKAGFEGSTDTEWDYPPYVVDTVQSISHDIAGLCNGDRVAFAWTASLPYQEPWCDTCSGITIYDGYLVGQMDNDVYYQQSFDQGVSWQPRVNLTKCQIGEAGYKAYSDLSLLIDGRDDLHIVWPACPWPADLCWDEGGFCWEEDWYVDNARLMHWSENYPYIRLIADQVYEVQSELWDSCWAGAWSLRITKPSISECDGRLYAIWTQFNNPKEGVINDCAEWAYDTYPGSDPTGAANGDIWYSVSDSWGYVWDLPRNLTNSYTPHCDPKFGEDCQSDNWASMTRLGRQIQAGEDWTGSVVVDPTGVYSGDHYLDIQFVNDLDAGGVIQDEGSWTDNPLKWFRLPCVAAQRWPDIWIEWTNCEAAVRAGETLDTTLGIYNEGNYTLFFSVDVEQDNGPEGWLGASGYVGQINPGVWFIDTVRIQLNKDGVITDPGLYTGRLIITGNDPYNLPANVEIQLMVEEYCCDVIGDYNGDGRFDILDLDDFIHWTFSIWPNFPYDCLEEVDVTSATPGVRDGFVSILDIDYLIGYLLRGTYPSLPPCP